MNFIIKSEKIKGIIKKPFLEMCNYLYSLDNFVLKSNSLAYIANVLNT